MNEQITENSNGWKYNYCGVNPAGEKEYLMMRSDAAGDYHVDMNLGGVNETFSIRHVDGFEPTLERFAEMVKLCKNPDRVRQEVIRNQPVNVKFN